jgi:hypothetical protein
MFDKWDGELAYAKINDQIVWTKNGESSNSIKRSINICGNNYPDPKFAMYEPVLIFIYFNKTN